MHFSKPLKIFLRVFTGFLVLILAFSFYATSTFAAIPVQKLSVLSEAVPTPTPSPVPVVPYSSAIEKLLSVIQTPPPIKKVEEINSCRYTPNTWIGKASFYTWDGCMGCNGARQMANGEILDDYKPTLAFMRAPLNTVVEIKNLDTGAKTVAKVTDRGGFEPLGRIADVSAAVKDKINLATDQSTIQITSLY